MKKSLLGIAATLMVVGAVSTAYASNSNDKNTSTEVSVGKEQKKVDSEGSSDGSSKGSFELLANQTVVKNSALSNESDSKSYAVPAGYNWVKVFVQNNSKKAISVSLQNTKTGAIVQLAPKGSTKYKDSNVIPAGQTIALYNGTSVGADTHIVSFSSEGDMTGSLASVKLATIKSELN